MNANFMSFKISVQFSTCSNFKGKTLQVRDHETLGLAFYKWSKEHDWELRFKAVGSNPWLWQQLFSPGLQITVIKAPSVRLIIIWIDQGHKFIFACGY